MTFKARTAILAQSLDGGKLARFTPELDPDETHRRELYLTLPLSRWLYQTDRKHSVNFKALVRAHLKVFVIGGQIDNSNYMKSLSPKDEEIWSIRTFFDPRVRIFAGFLAPDTLIALHWRMRSSLGSATDQRWRKAIDRAISVWDELFPAVPRLKGRPFSCCVTANGIDHFS